MRIKDKRSYLVHAQRSSPIPMTLYLLDTTGKTARSFSVPDQGGVSVTVPVGQTAEIVTADGQGPSSVTVNGAEATTATLTGIGHGGYIPTSHPHAGDIVVFIK